MLPAYLSGFSFSARLKFILCAGPFLILDARALARYSTFLSAAKPTDQGEESVVLVVVVVVVVVGPFFSLPCAVFWGMKRQKTLSKKGCEKAKTLSKKGCEKAKTSGPASLESFSLPCWSSWSKHEVRDLNNRTSEKKHLWKLHSKDCIF